MNTNPPIDGVYSPVSNHGIVTVKLNEITRQKALFANRFVKAGEVVAPFYPGLTQNYPTYLTVQVGIHTHITLEPTFLQFINHSCSPNVFFDTHHYQLIALQDVEEGDELTFFYPSTEWDMVQSFKCLCGSINCLGEIKGAAYLTQEQIHTYKLTHFIQSQLHARSNNQQRV